MEKQYPQGQLFVCNCNKYNTCYFIEKLLLSIAKIACL